MEVEGGGGEKARFEGLNFIPLFLCTRKVLWRSCPCVI